jgi:hypothetical protein
MAHKNLSWRLLELALSQGLENKHLHRKRMLHWQSHTYVGGVLILTGDEG